MLHEMYDKKAANMFFGFTAGGIMIGALGLMIESDDIFKAGGSLLFIGSIFLFSTMNKMLAYGKE